MMAVTALSGCFGGGDNGADPDDPDNDGMGGNQTLNPSVTIVEPFPPESVNVSESFMVHWFVDTGSNTTLEITHTAVHWADYSVADPQTPADYGGNASELSVGTIPGNFSANLTLEEAATYYYRAHAIIEDANYWSEERAIDVGSAGTTHTVEIVESLLGGGLTAEMDPDPITIAVGDSIMWSNTDSTAHTATEDDGAFDTGSIAGGESSAPVQFLEAGTFTYHCGIHTNTMTGYEVIVE
jgi:plastocyanin